MASSISFEGNNFGFQVGENTGQINAQLSLSPEEINQRCIRELRCPDSRAVRTRFTFEKDRMRPSLIEWILEEPLYKSWKDEDVICLLWIKGGAGKGKTMMAIGLIDRLLGPSQCDKPPIVTFFFCQRSNYELNTLAAIIKGLIFQLISQEEALKKCLRDRWNSAQNSFTENVTSWRNLWNIFREMLEFSKNSRIYIVVDALDECHGHDLADFLKLIVRSGLDYPNKIKWLLTSRPLDSAEKELLTGHDQVQVSLELNFEKISKAVRGYIAEKVNELDRRVRYGEKLRRQIENQLIKKAEGTFLWVSLVCKTLEAVRRDEAISVMQDLPPSLPLLYHQTLDQIRTGDTSEVEGCIRLLKVMTLAYRPLKIEELSSVSDLDFEVDTIKLLVDRCASFLRRRDNYIEFVHLSAQDFLLGNTGQSLLATYKPFGHDEIVQSCLSYLSRRLKPNIAGLPHPDSNRESLDALRSEKEHLLLDTMDYAATFWTQHLTDSKKLQVLQNILSHQEAIGAFIREKFLEWLECLSLLDKLPHAIGVLRVVTDLTNENQEITSIVQDATRFLLRHFHTISNWPLQIYSSAMIFSPESSLIRKSNIDRMPAWLRKVPLVERTWSALIQTLSHRSFNLDGQLQTRFDPVTAVTFSADGNQIASGFRSGTVRLWDATSGNIQNVLRHRDSEHAAATRDVAFSPDGKHIVVSGCNENIVRVWDTSTGDLEKTLEGYCNQILVEVSVSDSAHGRLTFNPHFFNESTALFRDNDEEITPQSGGCTLNVWDRMTGDLRRKLVGLPDFLFLAFSADGKWIAFESPSDDKTILLWAAETGEIQKTLAGHSSAIRTFVFAPDSKQIAVSLWDTTIKIWDVMTGDLQHTLTGHSGSVFTLAFSFDGKQIASASADMIKIWSAMNGDLLKTLETQDRSFTAVAFSPNSKQIVSDHVSGILRIWDIMCHDIQIIPARHPKWVESITLSLGNKQAISTALCRNHEDIGASWHEIKIWDVTTGEPIRTFKDHTSIEALIYGTRLAFSPDRRFIAVGPGDIVKIWDLATGDIQNELKAKNVDSIAFSPDEQHIASGSSDKTIKLWSIETGQLQNTLRIALVGRSKGRVCILVFSPDGRQVASGSEDGTIKLWDTTKGKLQSTLSGHPSFIR